MSENKEVMESLQSLKIQVDRGGQDHSFGDTSATWKFRNSISIVDLVEKYNNLLEETGEGLMSLKTQVNRGGQNYSFTDTYKIWTFMKSISVFDFKLASWYVIAFIFNIFGGLLGYYAVKDDKRNVANHFLIVGFISLFLLIILGYLGFISLIW